METQEHPHVARCCYELSLLQLHYMQPKQNSHFIHRLISPPHHQLKAVPAPEVIFLLLPSSSNRPRSSRLLSTRLGDSRAGTVEGLSRGTSSQRQREPQAARSRNTTLSLASCDTSWYYCSHQAGDSTLPPLSFLPVLKDSFPSI